MAEAKNQTAAKPRTRTAKTAAATPAKKAAVADETAKASAADTTSATDATKAPETAAKPVAKNTKAEAEKPVQPSPSAPSSPAAKPAASTKSAPSAPAPGAKSAPSAPSTDQSGNRLSVTIPLDSAVVGVAVKAVSLPVTAAKRVAQNRNGIPAYVAVGGLAVLGAVEWPVAAVGGLSLAALRRWGPLKPAATPANQESKKTA